MTESQGRAAIQTAMRIAAIAKCAAIVRLFAICQIFYRQPVGDESAEALEGLIGPDATTAMFYICGLSGGGRLALWEELVPIE